LWAIGHLLKFVGLVNEDFWERGRNAYLQEKEYKYTIISAVTKAITAFSASV